MALGITSAVTTALASLVIAGVETVVAGGSDALADRFAASPSEAAGFDGAPAVVLLDHGEIWPMDPPGRVESVMRVSRRVRVLSEAGAAKYGQLVIPTCPGLRLTSFEGSTTTADGEVLAVASDAIFSSRSDELGDFVAVVFPQVGVGAVVEYRYEIRYASRLEIDPWFFQREIPVLHSELRYHVPVSMKAAIWRRVPTEAEPARQMWSDERSRTLTFRMEDLPAVESVPFAPPFADRASQVIVYPRQVMEGTVRRALLDRWETVAAWYGRVYDEVAPLPRGLRRDLVHRLLSGVAQDDPIERARSLYRFVRDEIATSEKRGIWLQSGSSLERVLVAQRGSAVEKTLLLESLLREAGLTPRRVWAGDRGVREVDPELPNPMQLEKLLLSVEKEGAALFLDPSDSRLPFGYLLPENEGAWGVPVDGRRAVPFRLPATEADGNVRRVAIELAVDGAGRLDGRGELVLSGHHALPGRSLGDDAGQRYAAWMQWLERAFVGFRIERLLTEESAVEQRQVLRWQMEQSDEVAPGDGRDLPLNRPELVAVGPSEVDAERTLPVLLPFTGRDELELRLTWEPDFTLDGLPSDVDLHNAVGSVRSRLTLDPEQRRLVYRRTFGIHDRDVAVDALGHLRELLAARRESEAKTIRFVRGHSRCSPRLE